MASISFETVPCDFCRGREFVEELTGIDWEFDGSARYKVSKCRQCNLIQQNPRPDEKSIKYIYPDSYVFTMIERQQTWSIRSPDPHSEPQAKPLAFVHLDTVKKGTILDVGCGTGSALYPHGFSGSLMYLAIRGGEHTMRDK